MLAIDAHLTNGLLGTGCSAVAFETRDLRFITSHRQLYLLSTILNKLNLIDENKEKEA